MTFGSSGPVHRCGLKCLNTAFPHPLGVSTSQQMTLLALHSHRYIRGASQQQQPHKSNSSGHVKPLTPLLARKKRMPSLDPSPVSSSQPRCEAREFTSYTKLRHTGGALIINHKTLLFNRSPDHCILACHTGNSHHATDGYQSHRMNSNVRHTVHFQVRSGSE